MTLAEIDDAERQRHPALDPIGHAAPTAASRFSEVDPHQFGRPTADIEQDHAGGPRIDQRGAPGHRQLRLRLLRNDLQDETGLVGNHLDEFRAVFRRPAGFGGDQPRPRHLAIGKLVGADFQRLDSPEHRRLAEAPGCADPLSQPDDAGERVDDTESVVARGRDQEPAVVGAEIERAVEGASRRRRPALRFARRRGNHAFAVERCCLRPGSVPVRSDMRPGPRRIDRPAALASALPRLAIAQKRPRLAGSTRRWRLVDCGAKLPAGRIRANKRARIRVQRTVARRIHQIPHRRAPARKAAPRLHVTFSSISLSASRKLTSRPTVDASGAAAYTIAQPINRRRLRS